MPEIDVRASGEHRYDVTLTSDDGREADYQLTVSPAYLDEVAGENADEATTVRCALELMLAQDGEKVPSRFSLDEVERVYPGFDELLRAALRP